MTKREFYNAIAATETLSEEIRTFAAAAIKKLDETNAKRAAKPTKTAIANEPLIAQIVSMLNDEPQTATDLSAMMEVKPQKASSLLRKAVEKGLANSRDIKVKGRTCKGYTRIA